VSLPGIRSSDSGVHHIVVLFAGEIIGLIIPPPSCRVVLTICCLCQGLASFCYRISNRSKRLFGCKIAGAWLRMDVVIETLMLAAY
jgi:hypothetical protein